DRPREGEAGLAPVPGRGRGPRGDDLSTAPCGAGGEDQWLTSRPHRQPARERRWPRTRPSRTATAGSQVQLPPRAPPPFPAILGILGPASKTRSGQPQSPPERPPG